MEVEDYGRYCFDNGDYDSFLGYILQDISRISKYSAEEIQNLWGDIFNENLQTPVLIKIVKLLSALRQNRDNLNEYLPTLEKFNRMPIEATYQTCSTAEKQIILTNLLIFCNQEFGPIIYPLKDWQNSSYIIDVLKSNVHEKLHHDQIKYPELASQEAIRATTPFLNQVANKLEFYNPYYKDKNVDQVTIKIMVIGESGIGKSTMINSMYEPYIPEDNKLKECAGKRGPEELKSVNYVIERKVKESERMNFPETGKIKIHFNTVDTGGFYCVSNCSNRKDKNKSIEHENKLWNNILNDICLSNAKGEPYNMIIYCVRNRFTTIERDYCNRFKMLGIPIVIVAAYCVDKNVVTHLENSISEMKCSDDVDGPIPIISKKIPRDQPQANISAEGMDVLADTLSNTYNNKSIKSLIDIDQNNKLIIKGKFKTLFRKAIGVVTGCAISMAITSCALPPGLDIAAVILGMSTMITSLSLMYNIPFYKDWKYWAGIFTSSSIGATAVGASLGATVILSDLIQYTVAGLIVGLVLEASVVSSTVFIVGYIFAKTFDSLYRNNNNCTVFTEAQITKELKKQATKKSISEALREFKQRSSTKTQ